MVLNYLFLIKSSMKKYPLILAVMLISGCNEKIADLAPKGGKYFLDSLGDNINQNDIEQGIALKISDSDYNYRYGSLNGKLSGIPQTHRITNDVKDNVSLYSIPAVEGDNMVILNSSGILTKFKIIQEDKLVKVWQQSLNIGFASELSVGIKDGLVIVSCGSNSIMSFDLETGKEIWKTQVDSPIGSKPLFTNDTLVFFAKNDAAYAINHNSGELHWYLPNTINRYNRSLFSTTPLLIDGYIVQQTYDDQVRFINPKNGQVELIVYIGNLYKNVKGREFLNHYGNIAYDKYDKALYLTNSSGAIVKLKIGSNQPDWIMPAIVSKPIWLLDNIILTVNDLGSIVALSKSDGKVIWSKNIIKKLIDTSNEKDIFGNPKPYNEISLTPPIVIDNKIIVISSNHKLIIISPENGRILAIKNYKENIFGLAFTHNNKVYIIKDNGRTIMQL